MAKSPNRCECVECCDGEHPGCCRDCAGWGDQLGGAGLDYPCEHCDGTGVCPECGGAHGSDLPSDRRGANG